jgi:L-threonylcarbamoyladenylate synthase
VDGIEEAVAALARDELVAYPTETVWGLGANARSERAVARLRAWKGRGDDAPISVLIADPARLEAYGFELPAIARPLIDAFWPGALTLVLPCDAVGDARFATGIARDDGAVGVRCSAHPIAAALARAAEDAGAGPITATSLNRSGEPAAENAVRAARLCGESKEDPRRIDYSDCDAFGELASTVVDLTDGEPKILRAGEVTAEQVHDIAGAIEATRD